MPRENRKRGRRGEERERKTGSTAQTDANETPSKRQRFDQVEDGRRDWNVHDNEPENAFADGTAPDSQFDDYGAQFGYLDEAQETFFKQADLDIFFSDEAEQDREDSIVNVFFQAEQNELKMASHPLISKFLSKMIHITGQKQLIQLYDAFSGSFHDLISHRFGSHCCESLCIRTTELISQSASDPKETEDLQDRFLKLVTELLPNVSVYLTDSFGSHVVRVLATVLSGQALPREFLRRVLPSKKKAKPDSKATDPLAILEKDRVVPDSFQKRFSEVLVGMASHLERSGLREMALHPTASPTFQLLLKLEVGASSGKASTKLADSLVLAFFPPDIMIGEETKRWIDDLLQDPSGAHFLETAVQVVPGKIFKTLYRQYVLPELNKLAMDAMTNYVVAQCLVRLGRDDLQAAIAQLLPLMVDLVEHYRYDLLRTVVTRSFARELSLDSFCETFQSCYRMSSTDPRFNLCKFLKPRRRANVTVPPPNEEQKMSEPESVRQGLTFRSYQPPGKVQASILAQSMLSQPGPLYDLIANSISDLDSEALLDLAFDSVTSRTLRCLIESETVSTITLRKVIAKFFSSVQSTDEAPEPPLVAMASDTFASGIVDALWPATDKLTHLRERIASELAIGASGLRYDSVGHNVWTNWKMNVYCRDARRWTQNHKQETAQRRAKEQLAGEPASTEASRRATAPLGGASTKSSDQLTPLQRASLRAAEAAKRHEGASARRQASKATAS